MVVIVGILIGYFREYLSAVGESTIILSHINPNMLLFVFIPILIFENGFNCDWYVFKRAFFNIFLLGAPGVLWNTIIIGWVFKFILRYPDDKLNWDEAFIMGTVMSATDPVALVALLK